MQAKLYVILGSHACRAAMLMLEHKRIGYEVHRLPTGLHPGFVRMLGFSDQDRPVRLIDGARTPTVALADRLGTVPALRIDGIRAQTNRDIARLLDSLQGDPPLFPAEPARREAVEEAERWGDAALQMFARRLVMAAAMHGPDGLVNRADDGRLGPLLWRHTSIRLAGARFFGRFGFAVTAQAEQKMLGELPATLDQVDGWIASGVLNGESLNSADFMIAPSLALLSYRPDMRAELARRPLIALLDRLLPEPAVR